MHFPVEARLGEVPAFLNRLIRITGANAWNKRELYSFAATTAQVHTRLPPSAPNTLARRFIADLKSQVGLAAAVFEMRTAAHFMAKGFDVELHDLCHSGGFDFLCHKSTIEVEVECKAVSSDLGHRVHVLRQYQLGPLISEAMRQAHATGLLQLAVATVADRLYPRHDLMRAVGAAITQALLSKKSITSDQCVVDYYTAPIIGLPFDTNTPNLITEAAATEYCSGIAMPRTRTLSE